MADRYNGTFNWDCVLNVMYLIDQKNQFFKGGMFLQYTKYKYAVIMDMGTNIEEE